MTNVLSDQTQLKLLIKEVVMEIFEERHDLLQEIVQEILEDQGLVRAMQETECEKNMNKNEFLKLLDTTHEG